MRRVVKDRSGSKEGVAFGSGFSVGVKGLRFFFVIFCKGVGVMVTIMNDSTIKEPWSL